MRWPGCSEPVSQVRSLSQLWGLLWPQIIDWSSERDSVMMKCVTATIWLCFSSPILQCLRHSAGAVQVGCVEGCSLHAARQVWAQGPLPQRLERTWLWVVTGTQGLAHGLLAETRQPGLAGWDTWPEPHHSRFRQACGRALTLLSLHSQLAIQGC